MPPRPTTTRRSVRVSSRELSREPSREPDVETPQDRVQGFVRPHLPALTGTPSSRRQLSYGSAVEPLRRSGGSLQRLDIDDAVNQALQTPDDDEVFVRPQLPQRAQRPATADDEDELAAGHSRAKPPSRGALQRGPATVLNPPGYIFTGSDADSMRSFGLESDVYGDAAIASTPGSTPVPETRQPGRQPARRPARQPPQSTLKKVTEEQVPEQSPKKSAPRAAAANKARPGRPGVSQQVGRTQPEQKSAPDEENSGQEEDDESEEEQEAISAPFLSHHRQTNTPAPSHMRQASTRPTKSRRAVAVDQADAEPEREEQVQRPPTKATGIDPFAQNIAGPIKAKSSGAKFLTVQPSAKEWRRTGGEKGRGLFAQAAELGKKKTSFNTATYPDDAWERDTAIQRDIQAAEEQFAHDMAQAARERERVERGETRRQQWLWLTSIWPLPWLRQHFAVRPPRDADEDNLDDDDTDAPTDWGSLLHPMTYVQSIIWLVDKIMDYIVGLIDRLSGIDAHIRIPRPGTTFRWIIAGIIGLVLGVLFGPAMFAGLNAASSNIGMPRFGSVHWPDVANMPGKVGDLVPSISWPSWSFGGSKSDWDNISDLWESDDDKTHEQADKILKRYEKDLVSLKQATKIHHASLEKLKTVIPKVVHMELKSGKPVPTEEFWHALRNLIHEDGGFLTMEKRNGAYEFTSEQQWQAIVGRLNKDPTFASKLNASVLGLENRLDSKMAGVWDAWVKNNEEKITQLIGPALDKIKSAGSGREFDERLSRIVKEQLQGDEVQEVVVTRKEFIRHLQNEFAAHRTEIRGEINVLQPQLQDLRERIRVATENKPDGVTKAEVATLVKSLVLKTIADMNLGAMAKGKIHFHWDAELKNQVNYFGVGSGATIDAKITASTFDPLEKGMISEESYKKGIRGAHPFPPIAALNPWQDEGDCWCAARDLNHRGNPHGAALSVQLAHHIVPRHVVVEHILPGATTDPDARPRQIEIYAHIADGTVRNRVRDFAATHFPDNVDDWDLQAANYGTAFVKIGQFVYEGAELHGGVYVHRLHSDLVDLDAETDQVVVRAVSNYGAKTHTCFYRVRLFGERRPKV
ncbi:spindle pole body-associated protein sad1 [Dactylonectria estremocensis]|uniref:Spindle pole body-associated protein sad1 n=1 Tax=Dactylonectria estremocensis TaxID=1079267 RepID=A0A9P9FDF8_9HYPO|nr:spindle pole body-associated protein sad1 [Dactylonectria estremocensis]